jgi:hypothetical protein
VPPLFLKLHISATYQANLEKLVRSGNILKDNEINNFQFSNLNCLEMVTDQKEVFKEEALFFPRLYITIGEK